ncbi:hypothetical protein SAMN05192553_101677 [Cyclobacterium xiamenense]|uniref:Lipoprotein n=1 Tax=Cyclobacterium xiamenense TaxID=1297121 RepID=A0A1H6U736_9BACT|nr:hypothetical protein SAMN05192553_101677 [Cyclobacterium xiamenense]
MKRLKLVGVILWMALTLGGCGLIATDSKDMEPNTTNIKKPDEQDPGKG